jgi:multidrug efflux pump subunit AcrA (membrane-fusion protein)
MRLLSWMLCVGIAALGACAGDADGRDDGDAGVVAAPSRLAADSDGTAFVVLDSAERRRLDLLTVPVSAARWGGEREMVGEIVADPERVATIRAAVAGRLEAAPEAGWPSLGGAVREGQELAVVGDARPLTAPRRGRITQVLAQPGELVQPGQPLLVLADVDHPVARLVWFGEGGPQPPSDVMLAADGATRVRASLIGPALEADPVTRRPAFLYRAERSWAGSRPGTPVVASFGGGFAATAGVRVPAAAVVQWNGFAWVYQETSPGRYTRRRIETDRPMDSAWFVADVLQPGDGVVVRGAQALLSEEFRARITVGDESDK